MTYALGLPNTAACAVSLHGPLQLQIWAPFPLTASFFPTVARQSATHLLKQPFSHFASPLKDHLPPSHFWYHFQSVSRLHIAVLTLLAFVLASAEESSSGTSWGFEYALLIANQVWVFAVNS